MFLSKQKKKVVPVFWVHYLRVKWGRISPTQIFNWHLENTDLNGDIWLETHILEAIDVASITDKWVLRHKISDMKVESFILRKRQRKERQCRGFRQRA